MLVDTRDILGLSLSTRRLWEPHVTPLFRRLLSDKSRVRRRRRAYRFLHTYRLGDRRSRRVRLRALEPHSTTRELLEMNVKRNEAL